MVEDGERVQEVVDDEHQDHDVRLELQANSLQSRALLNSVVADNPGIDDLVSQAVVEPIQALLEPL